MTNSVTVPQIQPRLAAWVFPALAIGLGLLLCIPRYPTPDEPWYLQDISTICNTLAAGRWIGNENVGWHGFMFKIPPALALLVTGPSLFVATAVYVLYGALVCWLMQRMLQRYVVAWPMLLCGMWLLITSRHFLMSLATVLCEMPATLAALLVFLAVATRANRWVLGVALALVLDAKEGVFFAFAPAVLAWMILDEWQAPAGAAPWVRLRRLAARMTAGFLPAGALLVLMFCSGLVPLNMRDANILGLTTSGMHDMYFNFNPRHAAVNAQYSKENRTDAPDIGALVSNVLQRLRGAPPTQTNVVRNGVQGSGFGVQGRDAAEYRISKPAFDGTPSSKECPMMIPPTAGLQEEFCADTSHLDIECSILDIHQLTPHDWLMRRHPRLHYATLGLGAQGIVGVSADMCNLGLDYLRKILYFETFSFLSVPFFIVAPAVAMSLIMFRRWVRAGDTASAALPLLLWSYLLVYCTRISNGRYLLPVLPLLVLFMVLFLAEIGQRRGQTLAIFALTAALVMGGLWLEFRYVQVKIALNAVLLVAYGGVTVAALRRAPHLTRWLLAYCCLLGCVCVGVAVASMNANQGQLRSWRQYGYNGQTGQVAQYLPRHERVWVSGFSGNLLAFYTGDPVPTAEHTWRLQAWLPKEHLQRRYTSRFYGYRYRLLDRFRSDTLTNKVGLIVWTESAAQTNVPDVVRAEWLQLERTLALKNRTVYFLRVRQ
ncbi:MAG: hypothetical protein NTV22_11670 [bacterium]|nr:hypothetical protein [bacterium]